MRREPGAAVDTREEKRRSERREERARERVRSRRSVRAQPVVEDSGGRATGDPRRDDLRDGRGKERRERKREDRGERRIDDAVTTVAAGEELVQPGRRLGQPPAAVEERVREPAVIVVVGGEPDAGARIDSRRDHTDPYRGCSVRHGHSL